MAIGADHVARIVSQLYEAAYDPAQWQPIVETLRQTFHGSTACLVRIGPDLQPSDAISANGDPSFQVRYIEEFAGEVSALEAAVATAPTGLVYRDHALVGRDILRKSRFWNDWMAPQAMYGGLACKLLSNDPSFWIFDIQRGRNQDDFDDAEAELFSLLAPHIRRSVEIGRQLQTTYAVSSAFSHLPFGALLVDSQQRIITMNEAAEAMAADPDNAVRIKSGVLTIADVESASYLRRLIADACLMRDSFVPGLGGDFLITSRTPGRLPKTLSISIGPYIRNGVHSIPMEPCAIVVLREMTFELPVGFEEHIRNLFNLTAKEAGLASALVAGMSLKDAAADASIQFSTARSHLERIFLKTGTNQQSQLVALLKGAQPLLRRL